MAADHGEGEYNNHNGKPTKTSINNNNMNNNKNNYQQPKHVSTQ